MRQNRLVYNTTDCLPDRVAYPIRHHCSGTAMFPKLDTIKHNRYDVYNYQNKNNDPLSADWPPKALTCLESSGGVESLWGAITVKQKGLSRIYRYPVCVCVLQKGKGSSALCEGKWRSAWLLTSWKAAASGPTQAASLLWRSHLNVTSCLWLFSTRAICHGCFVHSTYDIWWTHETHTWCKTQTPVQVAHS